MGKILAGKKFSGNKIWWNWQYGRKHIFWRELNLAHKHKVEYDKCSFIQK